MDRKGGVSLLTLTVDTEREKGRSLGEKKEERDSKNKEYHTM